MVNLSLHPDGTAFDVDPRTIVRLGKVLGDADGDDPSRVVTTDAEFLVTESIRTITARIGEALALSDYLDRETGRSAAFALCRVAALTKPMEDSEDGDPTLVHLSTGGTLLVGESIRTLSARLSLDAGTQTVDVDLEGTSRPAVVVPAHVEAVLRLSGAEGPEATARSLVTLAGGTALACMDDPDRLRRIIAEAKPETSPDEPGLPAP